MATVQVRLIAHDVDAAIAFYCRHLGFKEVMHPAPAFAQSRLLGALSAHRAWRRPVDARWHEAAAGGWNRFSVEVENLAAPVEKSREAGVQFRNNIVTGVSGKQIVAEDHIRNPVELFEPILAEARLGESLSGQGSS